MTSDHSSKYTIDIMKQWALSKGGTCLSKEYINIITKLRWECQHGHQWSATPQSIRKGTWCPICARSNSRLSLSYFHRLAEEREGYCLSITYSNVNHKLRWKCKEEHEWEAQASQIKAGSWCPICAKNAKKLRLDEMHVLASRYEGECLSTTYTNARTKLRWRCKEGHEWDAPPYQIKGGSWCFICNSIFLRKYSIAALQKWAEQQGGNCLSHSYSNAFVPLTWECTLGHFWESSAVAIIRGFWCPECAQLYGTPRNVFYNKTIRDMQEIAKLKGGYCLSTEYIDGLTKLLWKCQKGHTWKARPHSIQRGSWCPICAREKQKKSIEDMHVIAAERDGWCLSETYINKRTPLRWKCHQGHIWAATLEGISHGTWCPICARERQKISMETLHSVAQQHQGVCLSTTYINALTPLQWQCHRGHIWAARYADISYGHWCPICAHQRTRKSVHVSNI